MKKIGLKGINTRKGMRKLKKEKEIKEF